MSNQTHGERVKDAAKKRREYLRAKAALTGLSLGTAVTGIICILVAMVAMIVVDLCLTPDGSALRGLAFGLVIGLPALVVVVWLGSLERISKKAKSLTYVPPVAEQIAALPAEAILVRGSEQPAASPGELLRAARGEFARGAADELLRGMETRQG